MFPLTTTIDRIIACDPSDARRRRFMMLLSNLQPWDGDKPITYERLLDFLDIDDVLFACRAEPQYDAIWRRYAVWCAKKVHHFASESLIFALTMAERNAAGEATDQKLAAAKDAARAVLTYAKEAMVAAVGTAGTAGIANAARDAANAANAAKLAAAEWSNGTTMRKQQADAFRMLVTTGELP